MDTRECLYDANQSFRTAKLSRYILLKQQYVHGVKQQIVLVLTSMLKVWSALVKDTIPVHTMLYHGQTYSNCPEKVPELKPAQGFLSANTYICLVSKNFSIDL